MTNSELFKSKVRAIGITPGTVNRKDLEIKKLTKIN